MRCVPPPPGSRPILTSGWPSLALGLAAAMRWWQARQISKPPPSAVPLMAATTGLPPVSWRRNSFCSWLNWSISLAASDVSAPSSISRSAPAKKSALPEARMMPLTLSSLSALLERAGIGRDRGLVQHVHRAAGHVPGDGGDAVAVDVVVDHVVSSFGVRPPRSLWFMRRTCKVRAPTIRRAR